MECDLIPLQSTFLDRIEIANAINNTNSLLSLGSYHFDFNMVG